MSLASLVADTLAAFTAAGVRATDDARNANPPCAVVGWPSGEFVMGKGRVHVTMTAQLVVGDSGSAGALKLADALLAKVATGVWSAVTFRPVGFQSPGGGDPLPAYELTWQTATNI